MSVLIWVQTVCKGYLQVTRVATSKERVDPYHAGYHYVPHSSSFFSQLHVTCMISVNNSMHLHFTSRVEVSWSGSIGLFCLLTIGYVISSTLYISK